LQKANQTEFLCVKQLHCIKVFTFITSAKEVMFLSALICLFVSSIMLAIFFYIIWWKGGIWATEEPIRFWWSSRSRYII